MCRFACMGMHACVATLQGLASVLCLCSTTRQTASICLSLLYFSCLKKYLSFSLCRPCCSRSRALSLLPFFLISPSPNTSLLQSFQNLLAPLFSHYQFDKTDSKHHNARAQLCDSVQTCTSVEDASHSHHKCGLLWDQFLLQFPTHNSCV